MSPEKRKKFARSGPGKNSADNKGRIMIKIMLTEKGRVVKGNMVRSVCVSDARVSEVYEAVEDALF